MFLIPIPLYDTPRLQGHRPWIVWTLIAVNAWIFFALVLRSFDPSGGPEISFDAALSAWGFRPAAPTVSTAFASMFLHADVLHLFGNMLYLWIFGDNVEARLGRVGFLLTYLVGGCAAVALHSLLSGSPTVPLVGASGAVSGLLGAYLVFFPGNRVVIGYVGAFLLFVRWGTVALPAIVVLLFYLMYENLLPAALGLGGPVAYGAHIGGFLFGAGLAGLVRRFRP